MAKNRQKRIKKDSLEKVIQRYFTGISWLLVIIAVCVVYWRFTVNSNEKMNQLLMTTAYLATDLIDGDIHSQLGRTTDENSGAYGYIQRQLQSIKSSHDSFEYVYTWRMNDDGQLVFIVDAEPEEGSFLGDIYPEEIELLGNNYSSLEGPVLEKNFTSDAWGSTRSVYAPIFTSTGKLDGVIGIDIKESIWNLDNSSFIKILVSIVALSLILSSVIARFVAKTIMMPFEGFVNEVHKSVESGFKYEILLKEDSLLGELSTAFNKAIRKAKKTKMDIDVEVERRTRELEKLTEVMSDREIKMRELKKELSQLKKKNDV